MPLWHSHVDVDNMSAFHCQLKHGNAPQLAYVCLWCGVSCFFHNSVLYTYAGAGLAKLTIICVPIVLCENVLSEGVLM